MNIHFIAIGGAAMHNLALALHDKGYTISGSDDAIYEPSRSRLADAGILPKEMGWFPERIHQDLDAVVLGMHAHADNPELKKAQELGVKIYSYPEFLYEQSKDKTRVVIGGSHGKTTITSMILHVMNYHDIDVDYMVGAQLEGFDRMVKLTDHNEFIVLEGDEYLSSTLDMRPKFHLYKANIALLSGVAWDHMNVFPTLENYVSQFEKFVESMVHGGALVYNAEDKELQRIAEQSSNAVKTFPYFTHPYEVDGDEVYLDTPDGPVEVEVFGAHNMSNIEGARWICLQMGIGDEEFYEAIATFKGASKRLETLPSSRCEVLLKDFAHSPSKVKATVEAVRERFPDKRLVAMSELHTYSSLNKDFLPHYEGALDAADEALVYYSDEAIAQKRLPPINKEDVMDAFQREDLQVCNNSEELKTYLDHASFENTVYLVMSSGNWGGVDVLGILS